MGSLGAMQDFPLRIMRLMDHAEREHGSREIVAARPDGTTVRTNWKQLAHDARRMGQALERLGVQPGDRVATLAMNHDRHLTSWFGVVGMGGVLHTMNPRLFDDQLAYIATHAEDRVLLYDAAFEQLVGRMKARWPTIQHYVRFDDQFDAWLAAEDGDYGWYEGDEREPCGLCYTSGTTGNPKGVLYEHRSTVLHALSIIAPDCFDVSARSVMLPVVPMFHANSWCIPYAAAIAGFKLVICGDNRPEHLCKLFNEEGVTHSAGVPTVWLGMIDHVERTGAALGKLRIVIIGGSAAPEATIRWFRKRGVHVNHLWGMTEMSPVGTIGAPPPDWDAMSDDEQVEYMTRAGRSMFGVELRTVDDKGNVLPRDGVTAGRLQTRGPAVVRRYFRQDQDCVDENQWLDTGDVAAIHPDGTIQITDRAKDVIKSGGEWISSIDVENIAMAHPSVQMAACVGMRHPKWDERPIIAVVKKPGTDVTREELLKFYEGKIAKWQIPDDVVFVEAIPLGATGKMLKTKLREQLKDYRLPTA
jgi:fatty-acyl-CoA synthase